MARTFEAEREPVYWQDFDADGDGFLSPTEYQSFINAGGIDLAVPRITQEELDSIEEETVLADLQAREDATTAAILEAAENGDIDVIQEILNSADSIVGDIAQTAALNAMYTSLFGDVLPPETLSTLGTSSGPPEFGRADLTDLINQYLDIIGGDPNNPENIRQAERLAFQDHIDATEESIDAAKNYAAVHGGNWWQYFQLPNREVELSVEYQPFDLDGDGVLNTEEMAEYVKEWEIKNGILYFQDGTEAGQAVAATADADGDGQITPEELQAWEAARENDIDPRPAMTAFLSDYGFNASPTAAWLEDYTRESGDSFLTGAAQILTQSIQDATLGMLNAFQQVILTQLESGNETISRPQLDPNDPAYALAGGAAIDAYLDRIFGGQDSVPRETILTSDEFYDVGISLATNVWSSPIMAESGTGIEATNQELIDRYVGVRDEYQESIAEPETPIGRFLDELQADVNELFKDVPENDVKTQAAKKGLNAMLQGAEAFFEQDAIQTTQAVALKAAGDLLQTATGALAMIGENPEDSSLNQLGKELAALGNDTYTDEFKTALKDIDAKIGAAEGFWDTGEAIFGALADHPVEFLVDKVGSELLQEIPLILASGGAATIVKGGAKALQVAKEVAEKWAQSAGFGTGVALDLAEAITGNAGQAYEDAMQNLLKEGVINPDTGKAYTQEEAEAKAQSIAINQGMIGGIITAASMGLGGNLYEKAISAEDGIERLGNAIFTQAPEAVKKAIHKYLGELGARVLGTGTAAVGEGLQEAIDETVTSLTLDWQMDAAGDFDRDYGGSAASGLIIGGLTGAGVGGGIGGASTVANWVKHSNAQVAEAVAAAEAAVLGGATAADAAAQLQTDLMNLEIDNASVRNDIANGVDDAGYLTEQEVFNTATQLGVELLPGQIEELAGDTDELAHMQDLIEDLTENIYGAPSDAEFDINNDGVLTGQELVERDQAMEAWRESNPDFEELTAPSIAELDTDGVTGISQEELVSYALAASNAVEERQTNIDDTRARFRALGYEPSNAEVFEYSTKKNEIPGYVDPRQLTSAELEAIAAEQNYELSDSDYNRVGQGGADFEQTQTTEATSLFDSLALSIQEIKDAAAAEGVTLSDAEAAALAGNIAADTTEAEALKVEQDKFDARAINAEEIAELAAAEGYTLAEGEAEALASMLPPGTTEESALATQRQVFDNKAVTLEELEAIAAAEGYTLTDADKELVGNVTEGSASALLDRKQTEFDDLVITAEELEAVAAATGYTLTDADRELIGAVAEGESASDILNQQRTTFQTSVDDAAAAATRQAYSDTIRTHITDNQGDFTEEEIQNFIDQAVASGSTTGVISSINTSMTNTRNQNALAAAFPDATPEEIAGLMEEIAGGKTIDQVIQDRNETIAAAALEAQNTANKNALTAAFPDATPEEIAELMAQITGGKTVDQVIQDRNEAIAAAQGEGEGEGEGAGVDQTGGQTGGETEGESILDQVTAFLLGAGLQLTQEEISKVVSDIESGVSTNIEDAVTGVVNARDTGDADADTDLDTDVDTDVDQGTGTGTDLSDQVDIEDTTIEGEQDDYVRVGDFNREVGTLQDNLIALINQLEANGIDRDDALAAAIGVPAGQEGGPSGIYAELSKFATADQLNVLKSVVDGVASTLGTTAADVAAIKTQMANLVTKADIEGLATKEEIKTLLDTELADLATRTEVENIVAREVEGLATQQDVTDAEERLKIRIGELEAAGETRFDAIDIALGELATELGATQDEVTQALAKFQLDINADIAELATKKQVADLEANLLARIEAYETQGYSRDVATQKAIEDANADIDQLAADLNTTKEDLTKQISDFQTKLEADLSKLATKEQVNKVEADILAKMAEYQAEGLTRDQALQKAIDDVATDLNVTKDQITTQLTEFQTSLAADIATLATKEQVSQLETDLYLKLAEYEAEGLTRDQATQAAIADLAEQMGINQEALLEQLGTTEDNLTTRINEVETNLTNQWDATQELISKTATETETKISEKIDTTTEQTQQQIAEANRRSAARDFLDLVLGAEDIAGQTVTVNQAPLADIRYIYDFQSPFATQQQAGFYGSASPYGVPMAAAKRQRPQGLGSIMQGPLNLGGRPPGMAKGGKVAYDFLDEISQIMSFGD